MPDMTTDSLLRTYISTKTWYGFIIKGQRFGRASDAFAAPQWLAARGLMPDGPFLLLVRTEVAGGLLAASQISVARAHEPHCRRPPSRQPADKVNTKSRYHPAAIQLPPLQWCSSRYLDLDWAAITGRLHPPSTVASALVPALPELQVGTNW